MQVLQIIHGNPQSYQPTSAQLVTRTHLIGNQQIQIATAKPTKQPPQILPKPPNQQAGGTQPKQQRTANTVTSQVSYIRNKNNIKKKLSISDNMYLINLNYFFCFFFTKR